MIVKDKSSSVSVSRRKRVTEPLKGPLCEKTTQIDPDNYVHGVFDLPMHRNAGSPAY